MVPRAPRRAVDAFSGVEGLLDPRKRAEAKERSRREDEEALASGKKTAADLRRENGRFSFPEGCVRVNYLAAKALA